MAVFSDASIATLALGYLGIGQPVTDLQAPGQLAEICRRSFDVARDLVLERTAWPLTTRIVTLGLVSQNPSPEWLYSYRYPVGCLALRRVFPHDLTGLYAPYTPYTQHAGMIDCYYRVASDATGRLIWTNVADADAEITAFTADAGEYSAHLSQCIAWQLAAEICGPLGKGDRRNECLANAESTYGRASALADRESFKRPQVPSSYITARR